MNNTIIDSKSNKKSFAQNHRFKKSLLTATGVVAANIMLLSISNLDLWSYHKNGGRGSCHRNKSPKGTIAVQSAKVQSAVAGLSDNCIIEVLKFLTAEKLLTTQLVNRAFYNKIIPFVCTSKNIKFGELETLKKMDNVFCITAPKSRNKVIMWLARYDCPPVDPNFIRDDLVTHNVTTIYIDKIYCSDFMDLYKLLSIGNLRKIHVDKLFITKHAKSLIPASIQKSGFKDRKIHANKLYYCRDIYDLSSINRMISHTQAADITD